MTSELNELELAPSADNGPARLWFVSSSMKGFIDTATAEFDGQGLLEQSAKLARCKSLDLRILMTDPALGDERAVQEGRARGDIPNEIEAHLATLKRLGVHREAVRFVPRTPTVFAIATRDVMLLNPYPYGTEAFRSVSIIVRKTPPGGANRTGDRDIYEQYERKHFDAPWAHAVEIEPRYWNDLGVQSPALNLAAGSG